VADHGGDHAGRLGVTRTNLPRIRRVFRALGRPASGRPIHKLPGDVIPFKDNIPNDSAPLVTLALILGNLVVYVAAVTRGGSLISGPDTPHSAILSMFLQPSIVALAGNLLYLWIFGNTIEDCMGPLRFIVFFFAGAFAALGVQMLIEPDASPVMFGSAGAISAVLGAYTVLYRGSRVITLVVIPLLFTVMEVPALVLLALWPAMQAAFSATGLTDWAALAGQAVSFALGARAIGLLATHRKPIPPTRVV
jgi:membrane associated rhomboid family serine protease